MGRQILLSMLSTDAEELLTQLKSDNPVVVVKRSDSNSADVKPLSTPLMDSSEPLILWNQNLLPELKRKRISGATVGDYYRIDERSQPVLEFGVSFLGTWCNKPLLTQRRIYGVFENKSEGFRRWFAQISRHVRKSFVRNPATLSGYVCPAAYEWFLQGGLLLPTFLPPNTPQWRAFFDEEDSICSRLNSTRSAGRDA